MNENNVWVCPQCQRENTGRFCTTCGKPRPEPSDAEAISIPELDAAINPGGTPEPEPVKAEMAEEAPKAEAPKEEVRHEQPKASAANAAFEKPRPIYTKPAKEKKSHPVLTVLLSGLVGLGAGVGGGYLAVKNFAPKTTVVYETVQAPAAAAATQEDTSSSAIPASTSSGSLSIQDVAEKASRSVVEIQVENTTTTFGMFGGTYTSKAAGSGVIISDDGYIITNNHVVAGANKTTVTTNDGTTYDATIVGTDSKTDIAVIKVNASGLTPATIGDSDKLRVGDTALVIGNPLGTLGGTVTDGIISATDREMTINNQTMNLIQTNAAINNGNSGGGLFDANGSLIGIVNAKDSGMTSSGAVIEGLGFAIPINTAMSVAKDLMESGYVTDRPTIGVGLQTLEMDYGNYTAGLYIAQVYEGGAAEAAGLMEGDRITMADGSNIASYTDLSRVLAKKKVGDTMELKIEREGREMDFTLTLTGPIASMQQN